MSEDKLEAALKLLLSYKNDIRENVIERIRETEEWKEIENLPHIDLAKHINTYEGDSPKHLWISCRLSGEDPFEKSLSKCTEILWDQSYDCETYKSIGYNDGMAVVVSDLLRILGKNDEADATYEALYNTD